MKSKAILVLNLRHFGRPGAPPRATKSGQERPKWPTAGPDRPKSGQESATSSPRAAQEAPRIAQNGSRSAKSGQEQPKGGQERHKSFQKALQSGPKAAKSGEKCPISCPQRVPRSPRATEKQATGFRNCNAEYAPTGRD